MWKVPLADLNYGSEEEQAILEVVRSRWLTMGPVTHAFEAEFAAFTGARHAIAVTNGTAALHLACLALNIGPNDEVIVPSLSFVATANAVLYTGAEVRFADIQSLQNLTIDPQSIAQLINDKTKAIIVMHYAGYPCDMDAITNLARLHNLYVIEDAAHAAGAWMNGRHLGTLGDIGCFSFFSNKNLATGEGGMIITNKDALAEKIRSIRSHGMTSLSWDRHKGHAYSYDVVNLGFNYRIDEIHAALGIQQLKKLSAGNFRRQEITRRYWSAFKKIPIDQADKNPTILTLPQVVTPFSQLEGNSTIQPSYHIFPLLLPDGLDRLSFINELRLAGIQTSIHYPPVHMFQYYRNRLLEDQMSPLEKRSIHLPITEQVAERQVTLPLYPGMSDEQVDYVSATSRQVLEKLGGK